MPPSGRRQPTGPQCSAHSMSSKESSDLSIGSPGHPVNNNSTEEDDENISNSYKIGEVLKICQINVEGLTRSKCEYLGRVLKEENCDVLLLQETHISDQTHFDRVCSIENFSCVENIFHRHHGISTYVKDNLIQECSIISKSVQDGIAILVVQINNLQVANVYKPPSVNWISPLMDLAHPAVYMGDFNSHHSLWGYNNDDHNGEFLVNWALSSNIHLVYDAKDLPTFLSGRWNSGTNPDLCFVSCDEFSFALPCFRSVGAAFPNSQHRPVFLEIGIRIPFTNSLPKPRWNFKKADWVGYSKAVDMNIRWIPASSENFDRFTGIILAAAKKFIPRGFRKHYIPAWSPECERLWHLYKLNGSSEIGSQLLLCLNKERESRWRELTESLDFTHSSRKAWDLLKKLGSAKCSQQSTNSLSPNKIASRLLLNSRVNVSAKTKAKIKVKLRKLRKRLSDSPFGYVVSLEEVNSAISRLKAGKAAGCDGIFPEFFIHLGKNARFWLSKFFSCCYANGTIPKIWKKSVVKAILKPGKSKDLPENYRPISLLCMGYKLLERIIYNRIVELLDAHVPVEQAGFRSERNCCDQVMALTTHIEAGFEDKLKTTLVFCDLSAAYDTVWVKGLIFKLAKILKCKASLNLINEMLTNRSFTLLLGTNISRRRHLNNGLPQGSVLAPLFFNVYTADFPSTMSRKFIYADDLVLAHQYKYDQHSEEIAINSIQNDLAIMDKYYREWRLRPNPNKCEALTCHLSNNTASSKINITFNGIPIRYNNFPKYLGVTLDRSLTFKQHCQGLRNKIKTRNNIILKLSGTRWGASAEVLRTSSLSLVYSAAEYCAPVWCESAHAKLVDVQLNCSMRIISGTLMATELTWLPILSNIAPPHLRREAALARECSKIMLNPALPIHNDLRNRSSASNRLVSRKPLWSKIENVHDIFNYSISDKWEELFRQQEFKNKHLISIPHEAVPGLHESRLRWVTLNRIRTNVGRCNHTLHQWYPDLFPAQCDCGYPDQTIDHIVNHCPLRSYEDGLLGLHSFSESCKFWIDSLDIHL